MDQRHPECVAEQFDMLVWVVLRTGVLVSATLVFGGGLRYLLRRGLSTPEYHVFRGEPGDLRSASGTVSDARSLSGRGLIQLGVLLLIAMPIVRVAFSVGSFIRRRDWMYAGIAAIVLMLLAYALCNGSHLALIADDTRGPLPGLSFGAYAPE